MGRGTDETVHIKIRDKEIYPSSWAEDGIIPDQLPSYRDGQEIDDDPVLEKYLLALYESDDQIYLAAAEKTSWLELQTVALPDSDNLEEIEDYLLRQGVAIEEWNDNAFILAPEVEREEVIEILLDLENENLHYSEEVEEFLS